MFTKSWYLLNGALLNRGLGVLKKVLLTKETKHKHEKKKNHRKQPKVILLFSAYMANLTFLNQMFHIHSLEAKTHINLKKILQFLLRALDEKKYRIDIVFLLWSVMYVSKW